MNSSAAEDTPAISVVIPVFNEREALPPLLGEIRSTLSEHNIDYELLVIDDGSTDGTGAWLDEAVRNVPHWRAVHLRRHAGQSAALLAGFRRARGEVLVTLDGDGQNPPAEIPRLLAALTDDVDLVVGYRARRRDSPWRRFQSSVANAVRNRLTGESVRDVGCSLRAIRSRFVWDLPLIDGMHRFLPTLCRLNGARRVVELPVDHRERARGRSKYDMRHRVLRGARDLLGVRWLQRRWLRYEVHRDD
ncbi:MAG: glycosyltransferase family 2 protein [Acidobacteriota bacterium]|nr:MAG: glycosyltransferase family 2 protein [Acidobacteriota bacterium]